MKRITFQFQGHGDRINWQCGDKTGSVTSLPQLKWALLAKFGAPLQLQETQTVKTPFAPLSFVVEADGSQS